MSTFSLVAVVEGPSDLRTLQTLVAAWTPRVEWADDGTFGLVGLEDP